MPCLQAGEEASLIKPRALEAAFDQQPLTADRAALAAAGLAPTEGSAGEGAAAGAGAAPMLAGQGQPLRVARKGCTHLASLINPRPRACSFVPSFFQALCPWSRSRQRQRMRPVMMRLQGQARPWRQRGRRCRCG